MQNLELLDNLSGALGLLSNFNLLNKSQIQNIYGKLNNLSTLQENTLSALIELAERVSRIYKAFTIYSNYPDKLIQELDEDTPHTVLNVKEYILKKAPTYEIKIDRTFFDEIWKKARFLSKTSILYKHLENANEIISNITQDNYKQVITQLFTLAGLIKLEDLDEVSKRRILAGINKIRLQLESIKIPSYSRFDDFLLNEVSPIITFLLSRFED